MSISRFKCKHCDKVNIVTMRKSDNRYIDVECLGCKRNFTIVLPKDKSKNLIKRYLFIIKCIFSLEVLLYLFLIAALIFCSWNMPSDVDTFHFTVNTLAGGTFIFILYIVISRIFIYYILDRIISKLSDKLFK